MVVDPSATCPLVGDDWRAEFDRVVEDVATIRSSPVEVVASLALAVVGPLPRPLHYYALFGATHGCDVVLSFVAASEGEGGRGGFIAEVEQKYTTFVDLESRPTLPRVELAALAAHLNALEAGGAHDSQAAKGGPGSAPLGQTPMPAPQREALAVGTATPDARAVGTTAAWRGERTVDSGPLLRFERSPLTKAERYGHPFERAAAGQPSRLDPSVIREAVVDFLTAAYGAGPGSGVGAAESEATSARKGWTWSDIRIFNDTLVRERLMRTWPGVVGHAGPASGVVWS
jgi:hypothetical protein